MAKRSKATEPAVRKSFLVFGGIVVGVAVLGFVVSTFVLGGGGGAADTTTPASSAAPAASSNPASVPGSVGTPATGGTTGTFPKNELKPGGRNPFSAKGGSTAAASTSGTPSAAAAAAAPVKATKAHTWQMLELSSGQATILVDGKKKIVKVGEELIEGYTFNSITGKCVTVKGTSVFGLCPGAQPISL